MGAIGALMRAKEDGMRIIENHCGWTWRGIREWVSCWARPIEVWGVEVTGSNPRRFTRRVKIGPVCFAWGEYADER